MRYRFLPSKKARANMWVTHQNLARAKGGHPGFLFTPKPPRPPAKPAPIAACAPVETAPEAPLTEPATKA
jgi:hypothetical protein